MWNGVCHSLCSNCIKIYLIFVKNFPWWNEFKHNIRCMCCVCLILGKIFSRKWLQRWCAQNRLCYWKCTVHVHHFIWWWCFCCCWSTNMRYRIIPLKITDFLKIYFHGINRILVEIEASEGIWGNWIEGIFNLLSDSFIIRPNSMRFFFFFKTNICYKIQELPLNIWIDRIFTTKKKKPKCFSKMQQGWSSRKAYFGNFHPAQKNNNFKLFRNKTNIQQKDSGSHENFKWDSPFSRQ